MYTLLVADFVSLMQAFFAGNWKIISLFHTIDPQHLQVQEQYRHVH